MIAIKTDMEQMPANCAECKLGWRLECRHGFKPGRPEFRPACTKKRPKDCPLFEVKEETTCHR